VKPVQPIFLLDLDHVLVQPHGYREGIRATLAYFTQRMGLSEIWPGEEALAHLEAVNMTCEWDQVAILLANLLETLTAERPDLTLPDSLADAMEYVRANGYPTPPQNLLPLITRLGEKFTPGREYARLALELSQSAGTEPLFPHLAGSKLLEQLLGDVRSLTGSLSTCVFQNFILGGDRFEAVYGLPRYFDGEPYLSLYDSVLLDKRSCTLLTSLWLTGKVGMAVFTARPSVPDFNHPVALHYSAEAELALELLGLMDLPLIGAGQMCWLAEGLGCADYKVLKPSPVQTLAAIGAANGMDARAALTAAGELVFQGRTEGFSELPPLSIHVFEDSGGNVRSVYEAGRLLKTLGIQTGVSAWGIAEDPVKQQALTAARAVLAPDIRTAIHSALRQEGLPSE
jgi:hypothetical protein